MPDKNQAMNYSHVYYAATDLNGIQATKREGRIIDSCMRCWKIVVNLTVQREKKNQ
jgi:hypothetical protein